MKGHIPSTGVQPALLAVTAAWALTACGGPPAHSELPLPQVASAQEPAAPQASQADDRAPRISEVREKVRQVFGDAVVPDASAGGRFTSGDFNADGWQDLAVLVTPSPGALAQVNASLANWIIKDALQGRPADPADGSRPQQVRAGERLLGVIHGYGPAGWRGAQARQAYLVRNAAGVDLASRPLAGLIQPPPGTTVAGDAITESIDGKPGFLYWNGARYIWRAR